MALRAAKLQSKQYSSHGAVRFVQQHMPRVAIVHVRMSGPARQNMVGDLAGRQRAPVLDC